MIEVLTGTGREKESGHWRSDKGLAVTLHCLLGSKYKGSEAGKRLRQLEERMLHETN